METPNDPNNSSGLTQKRKRGRPRKYVNPNLTPGEMQQNITSGGHVQTTPPGFRATNGNLPHRVDEHGVMMGQTIQGVVEATFDAGYLLTMKVGNTGTTLKGVVFKPDHYVPVGAHNDVAPGVQMIQRNEVPFPMPNHVGERYELHVNSQTNGSANHVQVPPAASNGQRGLSVPGQTPNYNFVPVVLQPANLSNGGPLDNPPFPLASQPAYQSAPMSFQQTSAEKDRALKSTGMPFSSPLTGFETLSQSSAESGFESSETIDGSLDDDEEDDDDDEALSVEPIQTLQPHNHHYPASMTNHLESYGTGKMTELLQAVQKQTKENN
ncbi:hypothetical protein ACFE04_006095 [Oxalis oulophora]